MKKTMKEQLCGKTAVSLLGLILFILLSGCSDPLGPPGSRGGAGKDPSKGTIVLNLGGAMGGATNASQSLASNAMYSVQYAMAAMSMSSVRYVINIYDAITHSGNPVYGPAEVIGGGRVSIEIAPGSYRINITASLNGIPYANGSSESVVVVTAGANSSASIKMNVDIERYFAGCASSNSVIDLPLAVTLDSFRWNDIINLIGQINNDRDTNSLPPCYLNLDLSGCKVPDGIIAPGIEYNNYGKAYIKSIVLPSETQAIGDRAFLSFTGLESVHIPGGVKSIGVLAFNNCGSLESVTIPGSVESIEDSAFAACAALTGVTFAAPSKVASIGNWTFQNCEKLASVTIPNSVESIGMLAFESCQELAVITFAAPGKISYIDSFAFFKCAVGSVTIPASVASIGERAFGSCNNLVSVTFEGITTDIGNSSVNTNAFEGGLENVYPQNGAGTYTWNGTAWT
jgi:hypothetical protein